MPPWSAPSLNPVDALAVAIVLLYVVQAYGHGWLLAVVQLAGFVLALLVALGGYAPLARQIVAFSPLPLPPDPPPQLLPLPGKDVREPRMENRGELSVPVARTARTATRSSWCLNTDYLDE